MKAALCTEVLYPLYGVERRVYEMARRLPNYGVKNEIATSTAATHFPGLAVTQVSKPTITAPPKRNYVNCVKYMKNLYRFLTENKFDIIDANGHMSLIPCSLASRKTGAPVVATLHDLYLTEWTAMYKGKAALLGLPFEMVSAKMHFDKMIVLNSSIRHKLIASLRFPEEKIEIIPSGIDTKELDCVKAKKKGGEILFAGRLVPQKNVDVLLKAFSLVEGSRLTIIGEGTERPRLLKLAKTLGISNRVNFLKPVPRKELIQRMKAAAAFVMPSRRENFGIAPLEAMYCGTATISTNTEGPKDYINDKENGMLAEIGDARHLADSLMTVLSDGTLRRRLERNGRKTAAKYDWNNIVKRISQLYNETVAA